MSSIAKMGNKAKSVVSMLLIINLQAADPTALYLLLQFYRQTIPETRQQHSCSNI